MAMSATPLAENGEETFKMDAIRHSESMTEIIDMIQGSDYR